MEHIFINNNNSDENSLCLYIRELKKGVEEVEIKLKNSIYLPLKIIENENKTEEIIFDNLQKNKFYTFEGRYKMNGNWIKIQEATFSPCAKPQNLSIDVEYKSTGINQRIYDNKQMINTPKFIDVIVS